MLNSDKLTTYLKITLFELEKKSLNTFIGVLWSLINPVFQIFIMYFIMNIVFRSNIDHIALWLCSSLTVWITTSTALLKSTSTLIARRALLQNSKISPSMLVLVDVLTEYVALIPFILFCFFYSAFIGTLSIGTMCVFFVVAMLMTFVYGASLILSTYTIIFRDIPHLLGLIVQVLFWLTPIAYQKASLPSIFNTLITLNPFTYYISSIQSLFLGEKVALSNYLIMIFLSVALYFIGIFVSSRQTSKYFIYL